MKVRFSLFAAALFTVSSCGLTQTEQDSSGEQAISFPDSPDGRAARLDLLEKATVNGATPPSTLAELVAGLPTKKICDSRSGEKVSCQPTYLGNEDSGQPVIRFPELRCDVIRPGDAEFEIPSGKTEKFYCFATDDKGRKQRIKVKYKSEEVFTEVATTRLLWKLGFAADTMQPVTVICNGCPQDPFPLLTSGNGKDGWPSRDTEQRFTFATIEEKFDGEKINIENSAGAEVLEGFTYPELLKNLATNPHLSDSEKDRREALAFINAFLYNLDTKAPNQRLACVKESNGVCSKAVALAHDLGFAFGGHPIAAKKLGLERWRTLGVWKNAGQCDASQYMNLAGIDIGISIKLSEGGRKEVDRLMGTLTTETLQALFATARFWAAGFSFHQASPEWPKATAWETTSAWAAAFESRIKEFRSVKQCSPRAQ